MPVSKDALQQFLSAIQPIAPVTHKAMFGGYGLYCEGVFFAVIDNDRLFFKVHPSVNLADFEAFNAEVWVIDSGQEMKNYRELPSSILETQELVIWIEKSVTAARKLKK